MTAQRLGFLCGAVGALCAMSVFGTDITIRDTLPDNDYGNPDGPVNEWTEVEKGAASGNQWDYRGFDFKPGTVDVSGVVTKSPIITVFGGYDFDGGTVGTGRRNGSRTTEPLTLGDVFIDLNGNALWGATAPTFPDGLGGNPAAGNNNWKWDLVIHFDQADAENNPGAIDYSVYALTEDANTQLLRTTDYSGTFNDQAGPWIYLSGGDPLGAGTAPVVNYPAGGPPSGGVDGSGLAGNKLILDLPLPVAQYVQDHWSDLTGLLAHVTQECGNDLLMGATPLWTTGTSDGGWTLVLLGGGLAGIGLMNRLRR